MVSIMFGFSLIQMDRELFEGCCRPGPLSLLSRAGFGQLIWHDRFVSILLERSFLAWRTEMSRSRSSPCAFRMRWTALPRVRLGHRAVLVSAHPKRC